MAMYLILPKPSTHQQLLTRQAIIMLLVVATGAMVQPIQRGRHATRQQHVQRQQQQQAMQAMQETTPQAGQEAPPQVKIMPGQGRPV